MPGVGILEKLISEILPGNGTSYCSASLEEVSVYSLLVYCDGWLLIGMCFPPDAAPYDLSLHVFALFPINEAPKVSQTMIHQSQS